MPPPDARTLAERLEYIRILTDQLLRARDTTDEVKLLSAQLRQELDAAQAIRDKRPSSDE